MQRLSHLPLFLQLVTVAALAMYVPAIHALVREDFTIARTFFYTGTLAVAVVALIALARGADARPPSLQGHLIALFAAFTALPLLLAVPLVESVEDVSFVDAYFEMLSSFTTTGATIFDAPERLAPSLHLWRALCGWLGGMMMWIAAVAVFAPLTLGGFEVTAQGEPGQTSQSALQITMAGALKRWQRASMQLIPVYGALTLALWGGLMVAGDVSIVALIHAMSILSTSGISPIGGVQNAASGVAGEVLMFLFLGFALSRAAFQPRRGTLRQKLLLNDPEFRLGLILVAGVPLLLFLRHWLGAYETELETDLIAGMRALWGGAFTVMSFLTTTGFESGDWAAARGWSGLGTPGLILMGLAMIGGGVATTAGGVKLLRVFALYLNGLREMEKLIHPSSVGRASASSSSIRRKGAVIAWVFFMLFAMSLAGIALALAALGLEFEPALILAVAGLTTTGPIVEVAGEQSIVLALLSTPQKLVLCWAMVLGRLEALAIIALLSPDLWRN